MGAMVTPPAGLCAFRVLKPAAALSLSFPAAEVRNYICDECGQTFKQRKHLSVHQMRHSGAKPLQ